MAGLYTKDITQSIEPAQANVATLGKGIEARAEGARLSANATGTMLKAAGFLAEQYVAYDVGRTQAEAEELTSEFYKKGVAEETLPIVQAQRDKVAAEGTSYSIRPDAAMRKQASIGQYDIEIQKLKDAVAGGMTNEQYVTRVSALTRQAIAKYPGLADDIRQKVSTITGLPYADRNKEMEYAKARFAKQAQKDSEYDPMKLVLKDIDDMSKVGTFGSREDLFTLYTNDRATYDARRKAYNENLAIETGVKNIKTQLDGQQAASDSEANVARGGFVTMFNGYLGMSVNSASTTTLENIYKPVLALMAKGENVSVNPAAFDTQIKMHNAQMKSSIIDARNETIAAVDRYLNTNPNISDTKRQQLKADITSAADLEMAKYADDKGVGLAAMSVIMTNYRDKSLKEQRDLIDLVIRQVDSMKNTPLVMAYYGMGASRENLKLTNKPFYDHMVRLEKLQTDATNGIIDKMEVYNALRETSLIIDAAGKDPAAVPASTDVSPESQKAAHAAMHSNSQTSLDKATRGSTLDAMEVNVISSAQATNVETGANSQILANDYKKIGDKIRQLPAESQAIISENVSRAARGNVMSMLSMKEMLETKHGVTITLGVTPTGQIMAMQTPLTPKEISATRNGVPLSEARRQSAAKEEAAVIEFNKQSKAKLSNLVFGTAMLVPEKTPVALANEFATIINNKQTYDGFYSNAPVAPAASPAVVTPTDADLEAQRLKYEADIAKGVDMGLSLKPPAQPPAVPPVAASAPAAPAPAVAAPVTSNAPKPKSQREATGKLIDETKNKPATRTTGRDLKVGEVVNGFTYTGGDPTNSANWKK